MSWNGDKLCTGSRDRDILCWDYRVPLVPTARLQAHKQEVCGLRWSPNHQLLASGGNDNKVHPYECVCVCVYMYVCFCVHGKLLTKNFILLLVCVCVVICMEHVLHLSCLEVQ